MGEDKPNVPAIAGGEVTYEQPGENGELAGIELLTVKRADEGAGAYFVVKTEGWSFDNVGELVAILGDAALRLEIEGDGKNG